VHGLSNHVGSTRWARVDLSSYTSLRQCLSGAFEAAQAMR
jgi:hypothetical protein